MLPQVKVRKGWSENGDNILGDVDEIEKVSYVYMHRQAHVRGSSSIIKLPYPEAGMCHPV